MYAAVPAAVARSANFLAAGLADAIDLVDRPLAVSLKQLLDVYQLH